MLLLACTHPENRTLLTTMPEWPEWLLEVLISNYEVSYIAYYLNLLLTFVFWVRHSCFLHSREDCFYKWIFVIWLLLVDCLSSRNNSSHVMLVDVLDAFFPICRPVNLKPHKETIYLRRLRRLKILYIVSSLSCWSTLCVLRMVGRLANNFELQFHLMTLFRMLWVLRSCYCLVS